MTELTPKQARFVDEYLLDLNATRAAIRAGYSARSANVQSAQLLAKPQIKAAIAASKIARSEATGIDAAWVLKRLAEEADADLADLYDEETNSLKPVHQWPKIWRQGLVAGVKADELFEGHGEDRIQIGYVKEVKLSDRVRRLELIGKHVNVNAFQDQVAVSGVEQLADRIARAKAKQGGK